MEDFETMGDYFNKYNPFFIKDGKNRIQHFKRYDDAYLYVLKAMVELCNRGYVDFSVVVKHLTKLDDDSCIDLMNMAGKSFPAMRMNYILIDWEHVEKYRSELEIIIKSLHMISDTDFDWASFEYAWTIFVPWLKTYLLKEQKDGEDNKEGNGEEV